MATFLSFCIRVLCFRRFETYGLCGDDVFLLTLVEASHALHRDVVRLRRSACKDNLPRVRADQVCHLLQIRCRRLSISS